MKLDQRQPPVLVLRLQSRHSGLQISDSTLEFEDSPAALVLEP